MFSAVTICIPRRLLSVLACLILPAAALAFEQSELDANRALWNSHGISDYDYVMQWLCRCVPGNRAALVSVRGETIVSVVYQDTRSTADPRFFLTIEQSFDKLQHALDANADGITAEFHPFLGYPRFVAIDHSRMIADEEQSYRASDLTVIPEPSALMLGFLALAAMGIIRHPQQAQRFHRVAAGSSGDRASVARRFRALLCS